MYVDDMPVSEALAWEADLDRQLADPAAAGTPAGEQALNDLDDVRRRLVELGHG